MLLQIFEMFQIYYVLFVVLLVAVSIAVMLAGQRAEKLLERESTGLFAGWWKWMNEPPPDNNPDYNMPLPKSMHLTNKWSPGYAQYVAQRWLNMM